MLSARVLFNDHHCRILWPRRGTRLSGQPRPFLPRSAARRPSTRRARTCSGVRLAAIAPVTQCRSRATTLLRRAIRDVLDQSDVQAALQARARQQAPHHAAQLAISEATNQLESERSQPAPGTATHQHVRE